jgi:uncharacterized membrane protein YciS (DUF1049 family)
MKSIFATFLMLLTSLPIFAQNSPSALTETLYGSGKIYVVVICVGVILFGLLLFLFTVDRRIKKLENKSSTKN